MDLDLVRLALTLTFLGSWDVPAQIVHAGVNAGTVQTLDEYCSTKLPEGNRASYRTLSIQEILRFCGNVDVYNDCLLSARGSTDTSQTYTVKLFEKLFPSEYDLKRAGYVYCTIGIQELYRFILNDVNNFIDCERNANTGQCEIEANSEDGLKDLKAAVAAHNQADIEKLSCKLSLDYIKCIQAQYTKCNQTFEAFFLYKFARLGGDCLSEHKFPNKLVLSDQCSSRSTNSFHSTSGAWSIKAGAWLMFAATIVWVFPAQPNFD